MKKRHHHEAAITAREMAIIKLRFGIDDPYGEGRTLNELGKLFGVSKERIRQLEARALRKLRNNPEIQKLRHFVKET